MDNIKEFNFKVNGFDMKASYFQRTIDEIFIPVLRKWTEMNKGKDQRFIIFLAAPPAVGKTTVSLFLEYLSKNLEGIEEIQAIGLDGFHFHSDYIRSHSVNIKGNEIPMSEVKGCLETFDIEKLKAKLKELETKNIMWPIYDRNIHDVV
ncbi:MAG TPA: nucleoside/nucleotide kinase family protein, partial [Clostridium sp.]